MIEIESYVERFPLREAFTIARGSRTVAVVLRVVLTDTRSGAKGQGECVPYARYGETPESVATQIREATLSGVPDREALQGLLPPGAARNALDCALWDLEAKRQGTTVAALAGLPAPAPVITAQTLSLNTPEAMGAAAHRLADQPLLKIKLGGRGNEDLARLEAIRAAAPKARLIVDANEGWDVADHDVLAPRFAALGVEMVEQPFPAGTDDVLLDMARTLPVCADESCHDRASLEGLRGKYEMVNIKLDKTGGLTEALALKRAAIDQGFSIMVGCMVGTSLAMAPALLVAQGAKVVDLDGPLFLREDRSPAMAHEAARLFPASPELWG
jgi:L-alanine-DL-glutamate epimerase-like enolase superfamily enzyme